MRWPRATVVVATLAALAAGTLVAAAPAFAVPYVNRGTSIGRNQLLSVRNQLVSPNGRFRMTLQIDGELVVRDRGRLIWTTHTRGAHAYLMMRGTGNVVVWSGSRTLWTSNTSGIGPDARLTMRDDGALVVTRPGGLVWSSRVGNRCRGYLSGKKVLVDLSEQFAWMCDRAQQEMTTYVTTGAIDLGDATPTGTWQVQGHQRDRWLYPAQGGAYFVHYWMPYDGDYGMHDSPWQDFPYGSPLYRTRGSHGCVHVPGVVMGWLFSWAVDGTLVRIRA